ncbi:MAG: hypothetical protein ACLQGP_29350 [Isosphaeraceae bacterium]
MRPSRFDRLTRWGAGAFIVLLVHGFCAPRSAEAGCHHLVVSKSERLRDFDQLDALVTGGSSASRSDDLTRGPMEEPGSQRPAPCSGPGCSKRVPTPIPTTIQAPDGTDHWGALSGPVVLPVGSPAERMTADPAPGSSPRESSIFHPPRA